MMAFLPPYTPELNPDEQVWNYAKREIGKKSIHNKEDMKEVIFSIMYEIQGKVDLIKSFFLLPDTKYAAV